MAARSRKERTAGIVYSWCCRGRGRGRRRKGGRTGWDGHGTLIYTEGSAIGERRRMGQEQQPRAQQISASVCASLASRPDHTRPRLAALPVRPRFWQLACHIRPLPHAVPAVPPLVQSASDPASSSRPSARQRVPRRRLLLALHSLPSVQRPRRSAHTTTVPPDPAGLASFSASLASPRLMLYHHRFSSSDPGGPLMPPNPTYCLAPAAVRSQRFCECARNHKRHHDHRQRSPGVQ